MKEETYKKAIVICSQDDLEAWSLEAIEPLSEVFVIGEYYNALYDMEMVKIKFQIDVCPQYYFVLPKKFIKIKEEK